MGADLAYTDKLKALIEISAGINLKFSDVDALTVYILEAGMKLVECESATLLIAEPDGAALRFTVVLGPSGRKDLSEFIVEKNSLAGWVFENKKPLLLNDVNKDKRFIPSFKTKQAIF